MSHLRCHVGNTVLLPPAWGSRYHSALVIDWIGVRKSLESHFARAFPKCRVTGVSLVPWQVDMARQLTHADNAEFLALSGERASRAATCRFISSNIDSRRNGFMPAKATEVHIVRRAPCVVVQARFDVVVANPLFEERWPPGELP